MDQLFKWENSKIFRKMMLVDRKYVNELYIYKVITVLLDPTEFL
jgi:hypothetical protein